MKKFIGIVLVLCSLALPLAGCKEAISTVTCNTISELEDIPGQILSTPESAETEPEYNYIHFRYDNIWTVSALVNYEIVDNGQNIKFEINDSRYRDKVFYTSMSNVELVYRDDSVDLLIDALQHMFEEDMSSSRALTLRKLIVVEHTKPMGNAYRDTIERALAARLKQPNDAPTSYEDYEVTYHRKMLPDEVKVTEYNYNSQSV